MTPEEQKELHKEAIKEAMQEWLDQRYQAVGKWTVKGFLAMMVVIVVWLYAAAHGWDIKF